MRRSHTLSLALIAGLASATLAQQAHQRFVRGVPVAQIRVNLATGERVATPWSLRSGNEAHRSQSDPVWLNNNADPCATGGWVGFIDDPDANADGFGDLFGGPCDGTGTFPCEGMWSSWWGDLYFPDTVVDRVVFRYATLIEDTDSDSDGIGDGVPGLNLFLNFADRDNGYGADSDISGRRCIIEFALTDLPGALGSLPPGFAAIYEVVLDLAQDSPSLVFELGDSDGIDDAGTGRSGGALYAKPTFADLDSDSFHDFSWGMRFDLSSIPQTQRAGAGFVTVAPKDGNPGDLPAHPADVMGLWTVDIYESGPSCPPSNVTPRIGTFYFHSSCEPGFESPFDSSFVELYGAPAPPLPHEGCNPADCAPPYGAFDFADVVAFLTFFGNASPNADLAEPFAALDFADVIAFLTWFWQGCP